MSACRTLLRVSIWVACLLSTGVHSATPAISAGGAHSIGLKTDGTVRTWGEDVFGQLGRAPEPGDDVSWNGVRFDVLEVEGNRIERIGVTFNERPLARRPEDDPFGDDGLD